MQWKMTRVRGGTTYASTSIWIPLRLGPTYADGSGKPSTRAGSKRGAYQVALAIAVTASSTVNPCFQALWVNSMATLLLYYEI